MVNESLYKRRGNFQDPAATQQGFNNFVRNHNDDFLFFLQRAATGNYNELIKLGRTLKDLNKLIVFIQSATKMQFEVVPLPFAFRHGTEYYRLLGFNDDEIANIHGFFDYVKETYNKDFEEYLSEDIEVLCSKP